MSTARTLLPFPAGLEVDRPAGGPAEAAARRVPHQGLDRLELIRFLHVALTITVHHGALAYLLGINALRDWEAASIACLLRAQPHGLLGPRPPGPASTTVRASH